MSKNILITGAAGFIGSHLAELCVKTGYNVKVFDRYNSFNNFGWLEKSKYKKDIEFILGDIRDYDSVSKAVNNCQIIFHLAALIGIPYSYISPLAYIRTNIEGTYNILESSKNFNIEQTIITSTSETYGSAQYTPMDEKHPLVGQSPYSASKIAADQLAFSYHASFDMPLKIIRPFNTYGPRQSERAIISSIINQCLNDNKFIKVGNILPSRDFTYVSDTCDAFLEVSKKEDFNGKVINVGNNTEISINDLLKKIMELTNVDKEIQIENLRERPLKSEVDRLMCDNKNILNNSDWKPKFTLEEGLLSTIKWLKNINDFSKSNLYNI